MMRHLSAPLRWTACFFVVLGLHVGGAAALLSRWSDEPADALNAPVIMVDMSPIAAAPTITPNDLPPDVIESQAQNGEQKPVEEPPEDVAETPVEPEKPVEVAEAKPEPETPVDIKPEPMTKAELSMLPTPRPKKIQKQPPKRQASLASATSAADRRAERMTAPQASTSANGNAMPDWRARVAAAIARHKRYPTDAQNRGEQGTANVAFLVDGRGRVHNARLQRSSGYSSLDSDAVAWVMRAQPFPPPPGEKSIFVTLPLAYSLR